MPADSPIPTIPGQPVDAALEDMLRSSVMCMGYLYSRLFHYRHHKEYTGLLYSTLFTGAQPVSFTRDTLNELESEDYFVSEKSDGVRVDRKNKFKYVPQLRFPTPNPQRIYTMENIVDHNDTIVDGELVIDKEPNGAYVTRYLAFDLLAYHGNSIIAKPFSSRLARLQQEFVTPYRDMMQWAADRLPKFVNAQPFKLTVKLMNRSYGVEKMFKEVLPNLKHGSDGLIFTSSVAPYVTSTNSKMLKWKPPSENTIDFKLTLQFPVKNGSQDRSQKPQFLLQEWQGGNDYVPFGRMTVDDKQWEEWRTSSTRLDGRIVEVNYNVKNETWHFFRFRDDKEHGNHSSVVRKVVQSIQDGVEADEVGANFTASPGPNQNSVEGTGEKCRRATSSLTCSELNERANRLAHHLIGLGVQPNSVVAISVERSFAMIVGVLAILKERAISHWTKVYQNGEDLQRVFSDVTSADPFRFYGVSIIGTDSFDLSGSMPSTTRLDDILRDVYIGWVATPGSSQ
ncbi:Dcp1p-Dcp2p decapping enzyme complex alpha subunit [Mortierella sp. NVP85]|nr:Dcp1p-Dcp2p decapping enzyme complex alpha subunit [Mortierella sp. NVP85]